MAKLTLVLVTHEEKLLEVECDSVTLPGSDGYMEILPGHTPIIATLDPGHLSYAEGSNRSTLVVASGFCEVSNDTVTVLADSAEQADQIDVEAARTSRSEAERAFADAAGDELEAARRQLQLADARIELAG